MKGRKHKLPPVIVQDEDDEPVAVEVLAAAILRMSEGTTAILDSGLHREDLVTLLVRRAQVNRGTITVVLESIDQLVDDYRKV